MKGLPAEDELGSGTNQAAWPLTFDCAPAMTID